MLGSAQITGRLVGHEEVSYEAFVKDGETVPGGTTHWVTLADPGTGEVARLKAKADLATQLREAWWGGLCTVTVRGFAKNNRVEYSVVQVLSALAPVKLPASAPTAA